MLYLEIILNLPVNQGFTYSYIPPENEKPELVPQIGKRPESEDGDGCFLGSTLPAHGGKFGVRHQHDLLVPGIRIPEP